MATPIDVEAIRDGVWHKHAAVARRRAKRLGYQAGRENAARPGHEHAVLVAAPSG